MHTHTRNEPSTYFIITEKNESFHRVIPQKSTTKHDYSVSNALRIDSPDLEQQPESNKIKIIIFHLIKLYGIHSICMKVANEIVYIHSDAHGYFTALALQTAENTFFSTHFLLRQASKI